MGHREGTSPLPAAWGSHCPGLSPAGCGSGGSSHAASLTLRVGGCGGRKAVSKELYQHPAGRHRLAPWKGCARISGAHECQRALGRSQERRHPQTIFSPFHPMQTSPGPVGLSPAVSTSCVPKQPRVPDTCWAGSVGMFWGDCWHIPNIEANHPHTMRIALALPSPGTEHSRCNTSKAQHGHCHHVHSAALPRKPAFASWQDGTERWEPLHYSPPHTPHHRMGATVRWMLVVGKGGPGPPTSFSCSSAEGRCVGAGLAPLHLLQLVLLSVGEGQPVGAGHGLALGAAGGGAGDTG